jgi:gamma-glutamylcyclotransferase (GGCT)/AIG2-like uncharacterized protein YtfP
MERNKIIHKVFIYGTLLDKKTRLNILKREPNFIPDKVMGYSIFKIKDSDNKFYPNAVSQKGSFLSGLVIDVYENELNKLDIYEGLLYKRIIIKTESGIDAWIYIA